MLKTIQISICLFSLTYFFYSFTEQTQLKETPYELRVPPGFPKPFIPDDNKLTFEKVKLGKKLFYDKILSGNKTISCSSCHLPEFSFTDSKRQSVGMLGSITERNSMPLVNLAWSNSFFWDGGAPTLELQILKPLTSHIEMNLQIDEAVERLNNDKLYKKMFLEAFGTKPDVNTLLKAIASFERTIVSANSKFDKYFYQKDSTVFNDSEKRGYRIFFDDSYKMHCASCHIGPNLTNDTYQNNGLYLDYPDQGRFKLSNLEEDKGKFKVPSLRNVAVTAPYMHDGSFQTLKEVVMHYNTGGKGKWHPNKSSHTHVHRGMELTEDEEEDLVNFLKTLTDEEFLTNPEYRLQ